MKKKVLSAVIAALLIVTSVTSTGFVVQASPVTEVQGTFSELEEKLNSLYTKIQELDEQITPLVNELNSNKTQIENINKEIENTNKEIEEAKVEITEKEEVLGQRLREVYKTGGQTSYISLIFSSDSFSDLISKVDSASRIVKIDQEVVEEITENKNQLDEKVESLEVKANEIVKINETVEKQKAEVEVKKEAQEPLVEEAKAEKVEFDKVHLTPAERELVSSYMATCNNSNSSLAELESARETLRAMKKGQIKSDTVKAEMDAAIENSKRFTSTKKAAEAAAVNRSGVVVSGDSAGIVSYAMQFLGRVYVYGATGPDVFDCSGLTQYVYRNKAGIGIGRTTYDQVGSGRSVSQSELQPGDLVFTSGHHVGIYVGGGNMIHAPQTGDVVKISKIWSFYQARRILN
jgi:peptidoglycan hydrolase CwlO-like protein